MDDARWERYAALGGFVFVALAVVGSFLPGAPPATDDTAAEIGTYIGDHAGALQASQVINGFGLIALAWWFGSLFRRMRAAEGGNPRLSIVAILGLALGGAMVMVSGALLSAASIRFDSIGPEGAHLLFTMSSVLLASSAFGVVAFLSAVCALNLRREMFPKWTSYVGYAAAVAFLIGGFGAGTDAAPVNAVGFVGFLIWSVWMIAVSTMMWRSTSATTP